MHNVWTYKLMLLWPQWAQLALLLGVTVLGKWAVAWWRWGFVLDVSASSLFGDIFLTIAFLIGAQVVTDGAPVSLSSWAYPNTHIVFLVMCFGLGVVVFFTTHEARHGTVVDFYHDAVLVPVYLYLAIALLPILWTSGSWTQNIAAHAFGIAWGLLVWYDFAHHRIDQLTWLRTQGSGTLKYILGI